MGHQQSRLPGHKTQTFYRHFGFILVSLLSPDFYMRPRISIRGLVRPLVGWLVRWLVGPSVRNALAFRLRTNAVYTAPLLVEQIKA